MGLCSLDQTPELSSEVNKRVTNTSSSSLTSGKFSDLTITHGSRKWKAHKVVVCSQSPVLESLIFNLPVCSPISRAQHQLTIPGYIIAQPHRLRRDLHPSHDRIPLLFDLYRHRVTARFLPHRPHSSLHSRLRTPNPWSAITSLQPLQQHPQRHGHRSRSIFRCHQRYLSVDDV